MLGTIVNVCAIAAGGLVGLCIKKAIKPAFEASINKALGIAVLIIGFSGVVSSMMTIKGTRLAASGTLVLIISLLLGTLIGEAMKIDERLLHLGTVLERRCGSSGFAASFVNGSLIYCVGAMAIIGALAEGLSGDSTVLMAKSVLDGISGIMLGATLGAGVIFAAVPVAIYQGGITLLAGFLQPVLVGATLDNLCAAGYALVMCIGINFIANTKIKTANMLPALPLAVILSLF